MADVWDILLAIISGGLVYLVTFFNEAKAQRKDDMKEYRVELKKHMDELIARARATRCGLREKSKLAIGRLIPIDPREMN